MKVYLDAYVLSGMNFGVGKPVHSCWTAHGGELHVWL